MSFFPEQNNWYLVTCSSLGNFSDVSRSHESSLVLSLVKDSGGEGGHELSGPFWSHGSKEEQLLHWKESAQIEQRRGNRCMHGKG